MKNGSLSELKNIYSLYKLRMNVVIKSAVLVIPIIALFVFLDTSDTYAGKWKFFNFGGISFHY